MDVHVRYDGDDADVDYMLQPFEPEKDFIITLEALPVLWNKTHRHYTNKFKRQEALEELLIIYKRINPLATIKDVRKKINTLRSNYRRQLRKTLSFESDDTGSHKKSFKQSWNFDHLRFFDKFDQPLKEDDGYSDAKIEYIPVSKKIKEEINNCEVQVVQEEVVGSYVVQPSPEISVPVKTSSNYIAFEWAETLSRLDHYQRVYAKKAINDILFEAELGNLTRCSVQINSIPVKISPQTSPNHSIHETDTGDGE